MQKQEAAQRPLFPRRCLGVGSNKKLFYFPSFFAVHTLIGSAKWSEVMAKTNTATYSFNFMLQVKLFARTHAVKHYSGSVSSFVCFHIVMKQLLNPTNPGTYSQDTRGKQGPNKYDVSDSHLITKINHMDQIWLHTSDILCLYPDWCCVSWTSIC